VSSWTNEIDSEPSRSAPDAGDPNNNSGSGKTGKSESEVDVVSLQDHLKWAEQHVVKKVVIFNFAGSTYPIVINSSLNLVDLTFCDYEMPCVYFFPKF